MKPMLDPKTDLKGATPETLARALLRPRKTGKTVSGSKIPVKKVSTDQGRDSMPHLVKGT